MNRVGIGFDVHRFAPDRRLIIGGIEIPHHLGLDGHSDADVALHAITDAILGAAGMGDIGEHFPPEDDQWRDADSGELLQRALQIIGPGWKLVNVDLVIMAQAPKIGPHRNEMRERISALLGVSPDSINVKATTTERLGFVGREEGIAAMATASLTAEASNVT
ncbi:MAG: 2-C-methyl-D-erythritol 2,4-cyclodiphosphate synthase [Sphaerobacteraceae bacterium]|nr:MAG: 2-C-methyl-D-erythritol 2,4-cyclodiphosphate synthase [Sphaerobacteraceae bacterium]